MCRSIKKLRRPEGQPTDEELEAAARQFVRKVSGYHKPSRANEEAFERAVREIARTTKELLSQVTVTGARRLEFQRVEASDSHLE